MFEPVVKKLRNPLPHVAGTARGADPSHREASSVKDGVIHSPT